MQRPVVPLAAGFERFLRWMSFAWAVAAIVGLELADAAGVIEHRPGFASYELAFRPVFFAGFALGAALAVRWLLLGGLIATTTATAMLAWYTRQLEPRSAVAVVAAFSVPGMAWLLLDLHDRIRRRAMVGVALAVFGAVVGFAIGTASWDRLFGPTHPASTAEIPIGSRVEWIWTGAVTAESATVVASPRHTGDHDMDDNDDMEGDDDMDDNDDMEGDVEDFDIVVRADDGSSAGRVPATRSGRVVRAELSGLDADTSYTVSVVGRDEPASTGVDEARFRTIAPGATDVTIAFGSCMRTGSNGAVFDAITAVRPDLFVEAGDLHYANIDNDDPDRFRDVLDVTLSRPGVSSLLRTTPVAYVWDDHDYGGNNADADSPSRPAAMAVYREYVPHHPLAGDTSPIFQAFDVGAVRVLLTDVRSAREPGRTMLGERQLQWLEDELLRSHRTRALTIWVSPVGWIGEPTPGGDSWDGYDAERRRLADFIADHDIDRLVMVNGDAHMVAIDDGTNSGYATDGEPGFPVLHAAALDRPGAVKGGPYSEGEFPGGGQFGLVEVSTTTGGIAVRLSGRDWTGATIVAYEREFRLEPAAAG
jgi:hypothetical protein